MFFPLPRPQERLPPQAAHGADDRRHRRRDPRLRPAAHHRGRLVRGRGSVRPLRAWSRATPFRWLPAAAQLRAEDPPGRRCSRRVLGQLVRRRLHQAKATSFRSSPSTRDVISTSIPIRAASCRAKGVPGGPQGRGRRDASSPTSTAGRSATRSRFGERSSPAPGRSRCAAIYDGADAKVDETQFYFHWDYLNETIKRHYPRRGDQVGMYFIEIRDPARQPQVSQDDRRDVQEFAGRDADRDREGVPAGLRRR